MKKSTGIGETGKKITTHLSNDIRRTRIKLDLLNQEGVNGLILDVVKLLGKNYDQGEILKELKDKYLKFLEENIPKDPIQQKLFKE